jgi:tRNA threonylcarbamoyladenosine biosynthesis protein TsaB
MLVLGIESATAQVGCAVGGHEGVLASAHSSRAKRHAEILTPQIDFVRRQARIELREIGVVAVDLGPGLFTGLRVGIASAMAIAHALTVPMIGVASLDLLAFPVRFTSKLIVAAIDARRGELFHAFYRPVPGGVQRVSEYELGTPEDLVADLEARGDDALVCGDGSLRFADAFAPLGGRVVLAGSAHASPSLSALADLAVARYAREEFCTPSEVLPMYLRQSDAELTWDRKGL